MLADFWIVGAGARRDFEDGARAARDGVDHGVVFGAGGWVGFGVDECAFEAFLCTSEVVCHLVAIVGLLGDFFEFFANGLHFFDARGASRGEEKPENESGKWG